MRLVASEDEAVTWFLDQIQSHVIVHTVASTDVQRLVKEPIVIDR